MAETITDSGSPGTVRVERDGAIARIVISNAARRNAMTRAMWERIPGSLDALRDDAGVRVIIITGDGEKAFVSGADISEFRKQRHSLEAVASYEAQVSRALQAVRDYPKPVIARINGHCIGGGMTLALSCDIRIAAEGARFGIPAGKLGLGYEYPYIQSLVGLVGPGKATEILFTARTYDAGEALQMGLVQSVAAATQLDQAVDTLANEIAALAPLSLLAAKRSVRAAAQFGDAACRREAEAAIAQCASSRDYAEGIAAFMEKRPARFTGR